MKKKYLLCVIFTYMVVLLSAQSITTAANFFKTVSEFYATIKDYEVDLDITTGQGKMAGRVSFKRPNLLRIDFTNPESQVIAFNGDQLTIYLPGSDAVLLQTVTNDAENNSSVTGVNIATPQGLNLLNRYYLIAYETGQEPEPLSEDSDEMVVKLVLSRKNISEGFKTLNIAINEETNLIRQILAESTTGEHFIFSFQNYVLNQNIPATRFIYDAPSSANNYNNFLFSE